MYDYEHTPQARDIIGFTQSFIIYYGVSFAIKTKQGGFQMLWLP
jgi:hypothetical protein